MSSEKNGLRWLIVGVVWLVIAGIGALGYKFVFKKQEEEKLMMATGSSSSYKHDLTLLTDPFSGYAPWRSESLSNELRSYGIRLSVENDGGDYDSRIKALKDGDAEFAVFTIDSLLTSGASLGEFPGTIILVLDESKGGDAIVAYDKKVKSIQDLNHKDTRFILTRNTPSEHIARVVKTSFRLPNLPDNWIIDADGSGDAFNKFKNQDSNSRTVAILWQPYVSKALEIPGAHVLFDSSRLRGQIVDVLVVGREFLKEKPGIVRTVVESYLRVNFFYGNDQDAFASLIQSDAKIFGEKISLEQAEQTIEGIHFKNTVENYAHFGLLRGREAKGLQTLEDMIRDIARVLVKTGVFNVSPVEGRETSLYYDQVVKGLMVDKFHPRKALDIVEGLEVDYDPEKIRGTDDLPILSDQQWDSLMPIGQMEIPTISFGRGKSSISRQSQRDLDELCNTLVSFPNCYIKIVGNARAEGDPEANLKLAADRADEVFSYLKGKGVDKKRMKATGATPSDRGGDSQSVSFILGQLPY